MFIVQVGYQQIAFFCYDCAECRQLGGRVGNKSTDCLAVCTYLKRPVPLFPLIERIDVIDRKAASNLGTNNEVLLVGGEGQLGDSKLEGNLGLRLKRAYLTATVLGELAFERLPHRLRCCDRDAIRAGSGNQASAGGNAYERRGWGWKRRPSGGQLDSGLAIQGQEPEILRTGYQCVRSRDERERAEIMESYLGLDDFKIRSLR